MESIIGKIKRLGLKMAFQKFIGFEAVFTCGVRKINEAPLYAGNVETPFNLMSYSSKYCYADPLLYDFSGDVYLYMEAFDRKQKKGCIACSKISNGKIETPRVIIEEPYHMSFPMIFEMKNEVYMIPETEAGGTINIYINSGNPYEWRLLQRIKTNISIVDSVVYSSKDDTVSIIASTFDLENPKLTKYIMFQLKRENNIFSIEYSNDFNSSSKYGYGNRNAGYIIGDLHCTQKSTPAIYGYSSVFYQLNSINEKNIDEQFVSEVRPEQIRMISDKKIKPIGTHTYSIVGDYEVIDLEYLDFNYKKWIR